MQTKVKLGWLLVTLLTSLASASAADIIPFRSTGWKYVLGTQEASNPTDAWRGIAFNDGAWLTGSAPVGYPSADGGPLELSIQTTLPTSAIGGYTCVFLRKTFTVSNPAGVTGLTLQVQHDDGFAAWINGTFVGAVGVAEPYTIATFASDHEVTVGEASLTPASGILVAGANVLTIQLFNSGPSSSDIFIDAHLTSAVDEPDPTASDTP